MILNSPKEYVSYYLNQYDLGKEEDSFHGLIESPYDIFDVLTDAFHHETNEIKQSFILDIISYFHDKRSYDILQTALASEKMNVWKSALDGLVALSDSIAIKIIEDICKMKKDPEFQIWAKEAISQIQENNSPDITIENTTAVNDTFICKPKTSKIDQETWICFWICISIPLSALLSLLFLSMGWLTPILFIAAVSHGMILLVKLLISKRDAKEKLNNGLLILAGLLAGPLFFIGLFFYIVTHMMIKLG